MLGRRVLPCFPPTPSPPTCLTLRLFPLSCLSPLLLAVWSVPLLPAAARLQTILEEDLEDPVYQVTLWQITWLLSPAAFLASQLALLCALWGDTFSAGSSDIHRYYVKSREVGGTKICAILVLVGLRACLGAWFPEIRVGFLGCFGEGFDSFLTFRCSSIKKCCSKILCDFTIFIPLAFLYLPHLPCHFFSFPLSTADVVVHCVWGGTRAHPWPIRRGHLSGTHKCVVLPACVIFFIVCQLQFQQHQQHDL